MTKVWWSPSKHTIDIAETTYSMDTQIHRSTDDMKTYCCPVVKLQDCQELLWQDRGSALTNLAHFKCHSALPVEVQSNIYMEHHSGANEYDSVNHVTPSRRCFKTVNINSLKINDSLWRKNLISIYWLWHGHLLIQARSWNQSTGPDSWHRGHEPWCRRHKPGTEGTTPGTDGPTPGAEGTTRYPWHTGPNPWHRGPNPWHRGPNPWPHHFLQWL